MVKLILGGVRLNKGDEIYLKVLQDIERGEYKLQAGQVFRIPVTEAYVNYISGEGRDHFGKWDKAYYTKGPTDSLPKNWKGEIGVLSLRKLELRPSVIFNGYNVGGFGGGNIYYAVIKAQ